MVSNGFHLLARGAVVIFAGGQMIQDGIVFDDAVLGPWVAPRVGMNSYVPGTGAAIGLVRNGKIVAVVLYTEFNGANVSCHIAVDGRMTRRFLSIIFHYPFVKLGVRRLTGVVASSNIHARKFDEHLGFEQEAILRIAHPDGDLIIYVMTADKCRWLKDLPYEKLFHTRNS